jgi:hypothetical protein
VDAKSSSTRRASAAACHQHLDRRERHVELLRHDLPERRLLVLPGVDASGEQRDLAVRTDREPRVEQARVDIRVRDRVAVGGRRQRQRHTERDDHGAAALEKRTPRELLLGDGGHDATIRFEAS